VRLVQRVAQQWEAFIVVGGSGAPLGAPNIDSSGWGSSPTLMADGADLPVVAYKPTLNSDVWVATYDGALSYTSTGYTARHASLGSGPTSPWYAFAQAPGPVQRRAPGGLWEDNNFGLSEHPDGVSG